MDIESEKTRTERKKQEFLSIFEQARCIISVAAQHTDISRQTFYNWMKTDLAFKKKIRAIEKIVPDMMEDKLKMLGYEGNTRAIIYYLEKNHKKYRKEKRKDSDIHIFQHTDNKKSGAMPESLEEKLYKIAGHRKNLYGSKKVDELRAFDKLNINAKMAQITELATNPYEA